VPAFPGGAWRDYGTFFSDGDTMRHAHAVEAGDRLFLWCDGGPAVGRTAVFPTPFEVDVEGGTYVLVDDGPPEQWRYDFVADGR